MSNFKVMIENHCTIHNLMMLQAGFKDTGTYRVIDPSTDPDYSKHVFPDVQFKEGDVVIDYNFTDDEVAKDHWNLWYTIYDSFFNRFRYNDIITVDEHDGSGNGLYYGGLVLREI